MIAKLKRQLVEEWFIREAFIHSTFKMNRAKLNSFAKIGSCMSTGITLAYFVLETGISEALKSGEESSTLLFRTIRSEKSNFNPYYLLTDKVGSQMAGIRNKFCMAPLLLMCHLK